MDELVYCENIDYEIKSSFLRRYERVNDLNLTQRLAYTHGDIFPDNTKFIINNLTGVFDFSEIAIRNRYVDLGIVVNSWCFDDRGLNFEKITSLIDSYNQKSFKKVTLAELKPFALYTALFFSLNRYLNIYKYKIYDETVQYEEYLDKFDIILKLLPDSLN